MGDPTFLILLAAIVLMMWWMSRRNKKQRAAAESFRDSLTVGQEVMTGSGLFGVISDVDGDRITLVSGPADSTSVWLRAAIAKLVDPPVEEDAFEEVEVPDDASELDSADVVTDEAVVTDVAESEDAPVIEVDEVVVDDGESAETAPEGDDESEDKKNPYE